MTRIAYFDLANGISGDMTLAALVGAGRRLDVDVESVIVRTVSSLGLDCAIEFVDDERGGIACIRVDVKTDGTRHSAQDLRRAIERADLTDHAQQHALASLDLLVNAEARVHGVEPDDVHFHELASADTAVDLAGAAAGIDALGIDRVTAAAVPVGSGHVRTEHGELPLPAPVTLELLHGATLRGVDDELELVTPSGAAILAGHDATFGPLPDMRLLAVGVGGGTRRTKRPNICRVLIGDADIDANLETCVLLETNIDDQTPELLAYAIEQLLAAGALDAWTTPIVMKKSRPGFALSVITRHDDEPRVTEALFVHTTTLGIRRRETTRWVLDREHLDVDIGGAVVRVKVGRLRGEVVNVAPEFSDCVDAAEHTGAAVKDVYAQALDAAQRLIARA